MIPLRRQMLLWVSALLLVTTGHIVLGAMLLDWQSPSPVAEPVTAALLIELAPLAAVTAPPALPVRALRQKPPALKKPAAPAQKPKPALVKATKPESARPAVNAQAPGEETSLSAAFVPPTTATATPAQGNVSHSTPNQAAATWQSRLLVHLARYKRYPDDARRRGVQGMNSLRLVIDAEGQVETFALVTLSGSPSLDRATLQLIRRAQPLPAPPAELLESGLVEVIAPVSYTLDKR